MSFKTKDEYEKEKNKWRNKKFQQQQPAGYEEFRANEKAWNESQSKGSTDSKSSSSKSNSMQIKGNASSSYSGDTMKINPKDSQFVDFGTAFSDKDLRDPGTKFAKKGNFKDYLNKIKSNAFDKDGNFIVPKFEMPDRVKLTDEQKKSNAAVDSKFDDQGFYKTPDIEMPKKGNTKVKSSYEKRAAKLADNLGINLNKPNNGKSILAEQSKRYDKKGKLSIPDFGLNDDKQSPGRKLLRKGKKNININRINTPKYQQGKI